MTAGPTRPARSDVVRAYLSFLGREPEAEDVIAHHMQASSVGLMELGIRRSPEYTALQHGKRFFSYSSTFDAEETILRHEDFDRVASPAHLTNFLGVRVSPGFFPGLLDGRESKVEGAPIPANWHADIAEWAAVLRAVELSGDTFAMAELGCGWGCWMTNTAVVAKREGKRVHVIGVEADASFVAFAHEALSDNDVLASEATIHWALVAAPGEAEQARGAAGGGLDDAPMITLEEVSRGHSRLDLLHIDIQGGEADVVRGALQLLDEKVAYLVIGTHSREIEGRLSGDLLASGWRLEIERPAILALEGARPEVVVDGVQGWRNPRLRPTLDSRRRRGRRVGQRR